MTPDPRDPVDPLDPLDPRINYEELDSVRGSSESWRAEQGSGKAYVLSIHKNHDFILLDICKDHDLVRCSCTRLITYALSIYKYHDFCVVLTPDSRCICCT